jgi:hypothetical protein
MHVANSDGGFDVLLSYTYAEELTNQTFAVAVTDHDANANASTDTFGVADAALSSSAADLTPPPATIEGQPFTAVPVFHFSDADPGASVDDFTAVVTLGDGNRVTLTSAGVIGTPPPGAGGKIVANSAGGFDVLLSYTYAEELTAATFAVAVTDHDASTGQSIDNFNVADAALTAASCRRRRSRACR